jgi:hypothetical protein
MTASFGGEYGISVSGGIPVVPGIASMAFNPDFHFLSELAIC